MIIQLQPDIAPEQLEALSDKLKAIEYSASKVETQFGKYVIGVGKKEFDIRAIGNMPGIRDIHRVSDDYKLVSKKWKVADTAIDLGDGLRIGGEDFAMMAGPCSIESEDQVADTIHHLVKIKEGFLLGVRVQKEYTKNNLYFV